VESRSLPFALRSGKARQRKVVQIDEAVQEVSRGINLYRQPPFGEVDLHLVRALAQAAADFHFVLVQQIVDELVARVARNLLARVHQTERRG
jgi:hypothetical protein